jgi:hypothetical protein
MFSQAAGVPVATMAGRGPAYPRLAAAFTQCAEPKRDVAVKPPVASTACVEIRTWATN